MSPDELDGDLHKWGEGKEQDVKGLSALGYPQGGQDDFKSPTGGILVPNYFPDSQIQALNSAIEALEDKYKQLLIYVYTLNMTDAEVSREEGVHRNKIPRRIEKAKGLLVKSRYWLAKGNN
ncbi:MAG: hypothetical protein ABUJ92_00310 [Desulfobacterales bacterium]